MPSSAVMLDVYLHLARAAEKEQKPLHRDKFLVLAAGVALQAGFEKIAEHCRKRLLAQNPNHLMHPYANVRDAFRSQDVRNYALQLLRVYPYEKAEYLLQKFRAGGYTGGHGYEEWLQAHGHVPAPAASWHFPKRLARPSHGSNGKHPEQPDSPNGKNGHAHHRTVPASRAIVSHRGHGRRRKSHPSRLSAVPSKPTPIPAPKLELDLPPKPFEPLAMPYAQPVGPVFSMNSATFLSWLFFAFALGIAACGILFTYFLPGNS